ncbi:Phosphoribosylformylglycinamidine synthase, synthetase subunit / Phosphoribosylformylglycinamidine synthase, glutamine amidotransferase subunit, partial [hydrothermal vent metagenome]
SLLISAFTNVKDITKSITPYFDNNNSHSLFYLDLAAGQKRLGASSLAQAYQQLGDVVPDLDNVEYMLEFWQIIQSAISQDLLAAYHDISDGGIFTTILEMCIASQAGATVNLDFSSKQSLAVLFSEELGAVIAVTQANCEQFNQLIEQFALSQHIYKIADTDLANDLSDKTLKFIHNGNQIFAQSLISLQQQWSKTSHLMASLRDNPQTCNQEFALIGNDDQGLSPKVAFNFDESIIAPYINTSRPKVAILREQGVNGQKEMAMAFHRAGFDSYDVHMQDLLAGKINLMDYQGMAVCGGFSYGDVLGAGKGWANSILFHQATKQQFRQYFADSTKFTLGVCNGCQMLSALTELIPGSKHWPVFVKNTSEQFEARFSAIKINQTNSIFFTGMQGAQIPVAISHGEGRAVFASADVATKANITASYVDNNGVATASYPFNPNGSQFATAAIANTSGNVMIMMPHPERVFRAVQMSWHPQQWQHNSPWMRMFYNARSFVK